MKIKMDSTIKSIDSLVADTQVGSSSADKKNIYKYFFSGAVESNNTENAFRILNYSIEKEY